MTAISDQKAAARAPFNTNISALRDSAREEAAHLVRLAAEPRTARDTITKCMHRASLRLGWSYTRVEDVWRKNARRIEAWELDQLRALRGAKKPPALTTTRRRAGLSGVAAHLAHSVASYRDKALEYERLAEGAIDAVEKRRHENWATYFRHLAQEAAKRERQTA